VWKKCELIVKNDSEEFGLFNNSDESTIECKFWIWMSTAKSASPMVERWVRRTASDDVDVDAQRRR